MKRPSKIEFVDKWCTEVKCYRTPVWQKHRSGDDISELDEHATIKTIVVEMQVGCIKDGDIDEWQPLIRKVWWHYDKEHDTLRLFINPSWVDASRRARFLMMLFILRKVKECRNPS